jgi:hypothetical protein
MVQLAPELIDAVVDQIADFGSLKCASLAARTFVCPTQRCIFRSISLAGAGLDSVYGYHMGTPALDLLNVLDSSPHLALYVRNLTIFSSNPGGSVEIILPLLHNVERLRILGYDVLWWELPRSLHTAVEDAISQPALQ